MIRTLSLAVLLAFSSGCVFTPHADFGEPLKLEDQLALPVSAVLEDPVQFAERAAADALRTAASVERATPKDGTPLVQHNTLAVAGATVIHVVKEAVLNECAA